MMPPMSDVETVKPADAALLCEVATYCTQLGAAEATEQSEVDLFNTFAARLRALADVLRVLSDSNLLRYVVHNPRMYGAPPATPDQAVCAVSIGLTAGELEALQSILPLPDA